MIPLPLITTLARSGALDRAWALFEQGGYDAATADAAALAVKGRLLKDRALKAGEGERNALLAQAEAAYAAADGLAPQAWLLINVATLAALRGERAGASELAALVLERLEQEGAVVAETPYWIAATRAEAHLVRGDITRADAALAAAITADPHSHDDHATTLRQFARLIEATGGEAGWLDRHRPPVSLHFAGHLGISADACSDLRAQVDRVLDDVRVGFGYGALAAGADIVIAEAILARGGDLHAILPAPVADFVELSVRPYGGNWLARFETCLAACASVHVAAEVDRSQYEPLATALAAELAMGAALLNAHRLESYAHQLLVVDGGDGPFGGGQSTARDGATWLRAGAPQHLIVAERTAPVAASSSKVEGRTDRELAALLRLDFAGLDMLGDSDFARARDDHIDPFLKRAGGLDRQPPHRQHWGNSLILGFADPASAAEYARALFKLSPSQRLPLCISGHYGLALRRGDVLLGPALSALEDIASMAFSGGLTVSEPFATALQLRERHDAQYVADCPLRVTGTVTRLFTLTV